MITITLQKIKDASPCESGWKTLLKSKGGTKADYFAEFPLADVLESNGLDDTLWCLRCLPEHNRIWRKYAVWCARQVEHLMTDERSLNALNVADRHADGLATDAELAAAGGAAWAAARGAARDAAWAAAGAATEAAAWAAAWAAAGDATGAATEAAAWAAAGGAAGDAARGAARGAARDAAWAAAWDATEAAARDAQKQRLIEALESGEWK